MAPPHLVYLRRHSLGLVDGRSLAKAAGIGRADADRIVRSKIPQAISMTWLWRVVAEQKNLFSRLLGKKGETESTDETSYPQCVKMLSAAPVIAMDPQALALILYTSGTTGEFKLVPFRTGQPAPAQRRGPCRGDGRHVGPRGGPGDGR